jgi:hypothetical protein
MNLIKKIKLFVLIFSVLGFFMPEQQAFSGLRGITRRLRNRHKSKKNRRKSKKNRRWRRKNRTNRRFKPVRISRRRYQRYYSPNKRSPYALNSFTSPSSYSPAQHQLNDQGFGSGNSIYAELTKHVAVPLDVVNKASNAFIAFSDTHGRCRNYNKMKQLMNELLPDRPGSTSVIFNGDFFPRHVDWTFLKKSQLPIHFLHRITDVSVSKEQLKILGIGNHEFLGGCYDYKANWINFVNEFNKIKIADPNQNIHIVNSNLLPAFTDRDCKNGIKDYHTSGNMGYVGWTTLEVFTNTGHSRAQNKNHDVYSLFYDGWIGAGIDLSATLNQLAGKRPFVDSCLPASKQINLDNLIIKEFTNNIDKCIHELSANNKSGKLYLTVVAHAPRWEILPVLHAAFNTLQRNHGRLFPRIVVNVITGHEHNETGPCGHTPPYYIRNFGGSFGFGKNPVVNILTPGPFGKAGMSAYFNEKEDNFYIKD